MNNYKQFFAAYKGAQAAGSTLTRDEVISDFTAGRTTSLKECHQHEINQMAELLTRQAGTKAPPVVDKKADRMRKAIISIFYKMNRSVAYAKIWAEQMGADGQKRGFNEYSTQELFMLIKKAEKALEDYNHTLRENLQAL